MNGFDGSDNRISSTETGIFRFNAIRTRDVSHIAIGGYDNYILFYSFSSLS
jgi:hypothetical protein